MTTAGFEPAKLNPFGHSGTLPIYLMYLRVPCIIYLFQQTEPYA